MIGMLIKFFAVCFVCGTGALIGYIAMIVDDLKKGEK